MGYRIRVLDPDPNSPAAQIADEHLCASLGNAEAIRDLARGADTITLEWENADPAALRELSGRIPVHPGPEVLEIAQHRVREKDAVRRLGLATAEYRSISSLADLHAAIGEIGTPAILKTARGGYDGRGQAPIEQPEEADRAYERLGPGRELILERRVPLRLEMSVICARNTNGEIATFPVAENAHCGGILDTTVAPARVPESLTRLAVQMGEAVTEGLGVVGVLAVEMFVTDTDQVLVNEIAPRPHNSGHYTWEACVTSQFEQQLRAVAGLPLGSPDLLRPAAMANLLGKHLGAGSGPVRALDQGGIALHLYGKREVRPQRKMGHLTALAVSPTEALERVTRARHALSEQPDTI